MAKAWPFIGRDEELCVLSDELLRGSAVVLVGESGVGKSRLAYEALLAAEAAGATVRRIVATASSRDLPLGAFSEWIEVTDQPDARVVGRVLDALTAEVNGPLIIGVDDAQWLDSLSAFVVHQLVSRKAASVLMTQRSHVPVPDAIHALQRSGQIRRIEVGDLTEAEIAALMEEVLGGPLEVRDTTRLWRMTGGNPLYVRALVAQERAADRLRRGDGIWRWTGEAVVAPGLADLLEARMGTLPADIADVLDTLAVAEPLPLSLLTDLWGATAVEQAEVRELTVVTSTSSDPEVRLAHPLFGEVRRSRADQQRLRDLRGLVASRLSPDSDAVRRATLVLESDLPPDTDLFLQASSQAVRLSDLPLVDRLAAAAIDAGAGIEARYIRAYALSWLSQGDLADQVLAEVDPGSLAATERAMLAYHRAISVLWGSATPQLARAHIEQADISDDAASQAIVAAVHTACNACEGDPLAAIESFAATRGAPLPLLPSTVSMWGAIVAHGDIGEDSVAEGFFDQAVRLMSTEVEAAHMRFAVTDAIVDAYLKAGRIGEALRLSQELGDLAQDLPGAAVVAAAGIGGVALLGNGMLTFARGALDFAVRAFGSLNDRNGLGYRYRIPRIVTLALSGATAEAQAAWVDLPSRVHPSWSYLEPDRVLAGAWVSATLGALEDARFQARESAMLAQRRGQYAREVVALQTLAEWGDPGGADRLLELADNLATPRAQAAAAFAAALRGGDGHGLNAAAEQFASIGDRLSALDAYALAATAFRNSDQRGPAIVALAEAKALASACGCAGTPALAEAAMPLSLSPREKEIITLVAEGLSNREAAERLTLSVRTVEGHLYRAGQRTGATTRAELAALVRAL